MAIANDPRKVNVDVRDTGDVEKRIIAMIKLYDEEYNRHYVGELAVTFHDAMQFITQSAADMLYWISLMELERQVDHISHAHIIAEWTHAMIVKWFVYKQLPKERWPETKTLMHVWHGFQNRTKPLYLRVMKDADKPYDFNHKKLCREIWDIDPNAAQMIWKKAWPD